MCMGPSSDEAYLIHNIKKVKKCVTSWYTLIMTGTCSHRDVQVHKLFTATQLPNPFLATKTISNYRMLHYSTDTTFQLAISTRVETGSGSLTRMTH